MPKEDLEDPPGKVSVQAGGLERLYDDIGREAEPYKILKLLNEGDLRWRACGGRLLQTIAVSAAATEALGVAIFRFEQELLGRCRRWRLLSGGGDGSRLPCLRPSRPAGRNPAEARCSQQSWISGE